MKNDRKSAFVFTCAVLFLSPALQAEETCPVELKLLLSPPTIQTVIASLRFEKETAGRVYFFDTDELDLLKQGVIVRVRQGASNDLTVKVRIPEREKQIQTTKLRGPFPCETNQTGAGKTTDYSVQRKYKVLRVPEMGSDIADLLNSQQKRLLEEAHVSIDWGRVERVANVKATKWETTAQSSFRKLALELWEWPAGDVLEISTKVAPGGGLSKYTELQRVVEIKGLSLSARQGNKTSMVLGILTHQASPPR
jgi:hypothetical protein